METLFPMVSEQPVALKDLAKAKRIDAFGIVRINASGYKYVTLLKDGVAENVYFSQGASELVEEGDDIQTFKTMSMRLTENADGESRLKITRSGGNYVNADSIVW